MSDALLIRKLKYKEEKTFAKLFESYKNLVFYQAYSVLNNRSDAEDVTQDVFIEFFNNIDDLKETTNIKLYLSTLSKRRAIDLYRKNASSNVSSVDNIETFGGDDDKYKSTSHLMKGIISEEEERIVNLRIVYDFSFKEIAEDLNQTINQIQGTYYYAIKKLKQHYKKGI